MLAYKESYNQIKNERMKNIIERMLDSYEKGGVSRRDFVRRLQESEQAKKHL